MKFNPEMPDSEEITHVTHDGQVEAVVFSPDGTLLATTSDDRSARVSLHPAQDLIK